MPGSGIRKQMRRAFLAVQPKALPASWFIARLPAREKAVALTFDDGPDPASTPRLLDILGRFRACATLFFIGRNAEAHPDLVREAVARGHQVSNHGYDHRVRPADGWPAYLENLRRGEQALAAASPAAAFRYFRPPRGAFPKRLLPWAVLNRRTLSLWSVDSGDSFGGPDCVLRTVSPTRLKSGDVVLLHEDKAETLDVLDKVIGGLLEAGYALGTLQRMSGRG